LNGIVYAVSLVRIDKKSFQDLHQGIDSLYIDLLLSSVTVEEYEGDYLMYSNDYAVKFENIESIIFQDGSSYTPDALIA
jgi:hypothetical protein